MKNKISIGITGKFLLNMFIVLSVTCVLVMVTAIYSTNKIIYDMIHTELREYSGFGMSLLESDYPGEWKVENGNLYKGDKKIDSNLPIFQFYKNSNVLATIFSGDVRIGTNIEPVNELIGTKASNEISTKVLKEGTPYIGSATINSNLYESIYVPIKDSSGNILGMLFIGKEKSFVKAEVTSIVMSIFVIDVISFILGLLSILVLSFKTKKNINLMLELSNSMNNFDFSKSISVRSRDEIAKLGDLFNTVCSNISDLVLEVKNNISTLNSNSSNLAAISEETASFTTEISESIQRISNATSIQEKQTSYCVDQIENISSNIEDLSSSIKSIDLISGKISESEKNTRNALKILSTNTSEANLASKEISVAIEKVDTAAKEINQILATIHQISDQTNLLSLNASIEAARAGENGRGFEVVASEIRKLAVVSKESVSNIQTLISNIQKESNNAVKKVVATIDIFNNQEKTVYETENMYNSLSEVIISLTNEIKDASVSNNSIIKHKNNIIEIMEKLHQLADDNARVISDIATSTEEQTAAIEEVASSAQILSEIAETLSLLTNKFQVKE